MILLLVLLATAADGMAQHKRYHGDGIDEVLQYVPIAATYAMKGFGMESRSSWKRLLVNTAASFVINAGTAYTLKHTIHSTRPDGTDNRSFPSGHTAIAFWGASVLRKEFGKKSIWISIAGYSLATLTAADRVRRNRHRWGDVAAGAALGVLSVEAGYWLGDLITGENRNIDVAVLPNGVQLIVSL